MPYNMNDYPASFKNLDHTVKKKAIDIVNGMIDNDYNEEDAIPIAIDQAKEWADNASEDELRAFKYGDRPQKDDDHEDSSGAEHTDSDVLVYFEDDSWVVRSETAKQPAERFEYKNQAIERAQRIADNRETKVIQYTKEGKKQ